MVPADERAELVGVEPVVQEDVAGFAVDKHLDRVVGAVQEFLQKRLAGMGERAVPDVVEERSRIDKPPVFIGEPELPAGDIGKVYCPQRMLKPGVVCAGIDKVGKPQLADIPEPLQCR